MTTEELLEQTLTVLETRGWAQGNFQSEDGVCLLGALAVADGVGIGHDYVPQLSPTGITTMGLLQESCGVQLVEYNDSHTYEDVVLLIKRTIEMARWLL